jgi:hypothetical protein
MERTEWLGSASAGRAKARQSWSSGLGQGRMVRRGAVRRAWLGSPGIARQSWAGIVRLVLVRTARQSRQGSPGWAGPAPEWSGSRGMARARSFGHGIDRGDRRGSQGFSGPGIVRLGPAANARHGMARQSWRCKVGKGRRARSGVDRTPRLGSQGRDRRRRPERARRGVERRRQSGRGEDRTGVVGSAGQSGLIVVVTSGRGEQGSQGQEVRSWVARHRVVRLCMAGVEIQRARW